MFRLLLLDLQQTGPFEKAHLDFATESPAITLITGENGTGKSILLDAIRGWFGMRVDTQRVPGSVASKRAG